MNLPLATVLATLVGISLSAPLTTPAINETDVSNFDLGIKPLPPVGSSNVLLVRGTLTEGKDLPARSLKKRTTVVLDVWQNANAEGRHEALYSDLNHCYSLGNGWNDAISIIIMPANAGCYFYKDAGCPTYGTWVEFPKKSSRQIYSLPSVFYNSCR